VKLSQKQVCVVVQNLKHGPATVFFIFQSGLWPQLWPPNTQIGYYVELTELLHLNILIRIRNNSISKRAD
jgi:hypothetical protein